MNWGSVNQQTKKVWDRPYIYRRVCPKLNRFALKHMDMKCSALVLILIGMMVNTSFSQKSPKIKFENNRHHFGQIKEESAPVDIRFRFKNTGNAPLRILDLQATCGCTAPSWIKESIQPGDSGWVTASFNPHNRPGYFSKTISVTTNTEPKVSVLTIEGNVKPKSKSIDDEYPTEMGKLRVKSKTLHLGKVLTTSEATEKSFEIYNDSHDTLKLTTFEKAEHIKLKYTSKIPPHTIEKLVVVFDAKAYGDLGYSYDKLVLLTNETSKARKEFFVSADVQEYFPPMTEQELAKAPKLVLENPLHDFGNIKDSEVVDIGLVLRNEGLSDLNIRKVKSNCDCVTLQLEKNTLESGEAVSLRIVFNPEGKISYQQKSISIFSNDPQSPIQVITIKANILE